MTRQSPGQCTFWAPRSRAYCFACRSVMRGTIADHAATRQHRDATRPARDTSGPVGRERPAWRTGLQADDCGTARQNAAAARRLGIVL